MRANKPLLCEDDLKFCLENDPKLFENSFELSIKNLWMLESKFCLMPANLPLKCEDNLIQIVGWQPEIIWKLFENPLTKPINDKKKQV